MQTYLHTFIQHPTTHILCTMPLTHTHIHTLHVHCMYTYKQTHVSNWRDRLWLWWCVWVCVWVSKTSPCVPCLSHIHQHYNQLCHPQTLYVHVQVNCEPPLSTHNTHIYKYTHIPTSHVTCTCPCISTCAYNYASHPKHIHTHTHTLPFHTHNVHVFTCASPVT